MQYQGRAAPHHKRHDGCQEKGGNQGRQRRVGRSRGEPVEPPNATVDAVEAARVVHRDCAEGQLSGGGGNHNGCQDEGHQHMPLLKVLWLAMTKVVGQPATRQWA